MTNTTDLIPSGLCQERGCGLGRAAGVHSGQEDDYHGYSPPIRTSPEAEAAIAEMHTALDLALAALYDYGDSSVVRDVEAAIEAAALAGLGQEKAP